MFLRNLSKKRSRVRLRLESLDERAMPSGYHQTNLVADGPGIAQRTDPSLVDAWGISLSQTGGAFWVSAHGTGTSPLYTGDINGSAVGRPFAVNIPGGSLTGQVFSSSADFVVRSGTSSGPARFIFAADTGFITGWNPAVPPPPLSLQAQVAVSRPGEAKYTGLAIANNGTGNFLYAADLMNGRIDVFDKDYAPASLAGNFTDPNLPDDYVPYNIQEIGGKLYATFMKAPKTTPSGIVPSPGHGLIDEFDVNGNFLRRLATGGPLFSPWGLAKAPADFGTFSNALLVGSHTKGTISAYDLANGQFLGFLKSDSGPPIRIDGLFGLAFGNGVSAGDKNALYFAAGPNGGQNGLFGSLRFVPDDSGVFGPLIHSASGRDRGISVEGINRPAATAGHVNVPDRPTRRISAGPRAARLAMPASPQTQVVTKSIEVRAEAASLDAVLGDSTL